MDEDWDLIDVDHLERAAELLADKPKAGELLGSIQKRLLLAEWHMATVRLNMLRAELAAANQRQLLEGVDPLAGHSNAELGVLPDAANWSANDDNQ